MRAEYKPELPEIAINERRHMKVLDLQWAVNESDISDSNHNLTDHKSRNREITINGLENYNGRSSFANATIQLIVNCILTSNLLRDLTKNSNCPLKQLLFMYANNHSDLSTSILLKDIGNHFNTNGETDPLLLFDLLCKKYNEIKKLFTNHLQYVDRCNTNCSYVNTYSEETIRLSFPIPSSITNINSLLRESYSYWRKEKSTCPKCGQETECQRKITVSSPGRFVVMSLNIFSDDEKLDKSYTKGIFKAIPTEKVNICHNIYMIKSAIFHEGNSISQGHFYSMIKGNTSSKWVKVDDLNHKYERWPVNSKQAYILFLYNKHSKSSKV